MNNGLASSHTWGATQARVRRSRHHNVNFLACTFCSRDEVGTAITKLPTSPKHIKLWVLATRSLIHLCADKTSRVPNLIVGIGEAFVPSRSPWWSEWSAWNETRWNWWLWQHHWAWRGDIGTVIDPLCLKEVEAECDATRELPYC